LFPWRLLNDYRVSEVWLMRNSPVRLPFGAVLSRRNAVRTWMRSPASRQSRYALDCLNFLIGSVQTGLGTFVAFYLASLGWSKESVGLALATGQVAGVLGQIPGGAITDAIDWKVMLGTSRSLRS